MLTQEIKKILESETGDGKDVIMLIAERVEELEEEVKQLKKEKGK